MAALSTNMLATTTARANAARAGSARFGYTPRDTVNAARTGTGPLVRHTMTYPAVQTYTTVKAP